MTIPARIDNTRRCSHCGALIGTVTRAPDLSGRPLLQTASGLVSALNLLCVCGNWYYWRSSDEHLRRALPCSPAAWPNGSV